MHARKLVLSGLALALAPSATGLASVVGETSQQRAADGATVRGPDAHVLRRPKGDIIEFRDAAPAVSPTGAYVAPYANWRFVRMLPGQRLRPVFFAARYQVANPAGLAAARGRRRWIHYGSDLLLVNIRTGEILRVARDRYR